MPRESVQSVSDELELFVVAEMKFPFESFRLPFITGEIVSPDLSRTTQVPPEAFK